MSKPRAYTKEEIRKQFLEHIQGMLRYWETTELRSPHFDPAKETEMHYRMSGLAFSILAAIDGSAMALPAFKLIAAPHEDDKEFNRSEGENWYPEDVDIAGCLHEEWRQ